MKINQNSWHYRLMKFYDCTVPQYLCGYFWKTVMLTMISISLILVVLACMVFLLFAPGQILTEINFLEFEWAWSQLPAMIGASLIIDAATCAVFFVLVYGLSSTIRFDVNSWILGRFGKNYDEIVRDRRRTRTARAQAREYERQHNPGLIRAMLRAKKQKFCPHLEFVKND
ncbi:MAG: hypothetical protein [Caudoviricetes sp.]|nr:MAG: hypothetical protein [Caudoviricetes sp.]